MAKPDSLRGHKAEIRSAIDNGHLLESWNPELKLIEQSSYMKFFRSRWGFFCGQVLGRLPILSRRYCSLLGYQILGEVQSPASIRKITTTKVCQVIFRILLILCLTFA